MMRTFIEVYAAGLRLEEKEDDNICGERQCGDVGKAAPVMCCQRKGQHKKDSTTLLLSLHLGCRFIKNDTY
jgi:hypothetical protein